MELPVIIAIPASIIIGIIIFAIKIIVKDYIDWRKTEEELERQVRDSEKPHIEPLYRRRYKK